MANTLTIVGESGKVYEVSANGVVEVTNPSDLEAAKSTAGNVDTELCAPQSEAKPGIMFTFVRLPPLK